MAYLKEFEERISQEDYPSFLKLWEEYCYCDEVDAKELIQILDKTLDSKLAKPFGRHVEKGLSLWGKITNTELAKEVLKRILDLQTTNSETLYQVTCQYLEDHFAQDPLYQEKLRLVGIRTTPLHFQGAIRNFELLNHLKKGNFVFHKAGWGTGEIMDFSFLREEISLECDLVVGLKHLSFKNAFHTLMPLPKEHFLARRFGNPDLLEEEAKKNPVGIIRLLLKDLGPKTSLEIKEELCDLVIPSEDWNRWWQTARAKVKKDTKIESPKEGKDPFLLREEELSHEVAFYKALEKKPSIEQTIQMVYTFLRDFPETLKNADFRKSLKTKLEEILQAGILPEEYRLQSLFFLEDIEGDKETKKKIADFIQTSSTLPDTIGKVEILAYKKRILTLIQKFRKDWKEFFLNFLFSMEPNMIRDYVFQELLEADPTALENKLVQLVQQPVYYPEAVVWYFIKLIEDSEKKIPLSRANQRNQFFEAFLILLAHLSGKSEYKHLTKKMFHLLTQKRYKIVRDIFKQASTQEVKEYLLLATKCDVLNERDIKIMESLARVAHPILNQNFPEEEENVIWTTEEGYQKARKRMEEISSVEMIQNAKEIEEARSYGDLRENAEYKFALEKRDRLQAELKFLSEQVNRSRIFTEKDILTSKVGIGSIVICEDSKGNQTQYTLLGPWDANPEKNILSFQSKFAQAMKGKAKQETFEFQGEHFTIKDIQSYLDS